MRNRTRRDFLRLGALGGAAALSRAASAAPPPPPRPAASATPSAPFAFEEATLEDLQRQMSAGTLTSRRLTEAYLSRIAALDRKGPRSTTSSKSTRMRSRSRPRWTRSGARRACAVRCTASRSC